MISDKRILVPLDFSPSATDVLEAAETLATAEGCGLVILHVVEPVDSMRQRPPLILTDILDDYARLVRRIPADQVKVLALEGEPIETIIEAATACRCHVIVMGRGGKGNLTGHVAAGVNERIGHKTHLISAKPIGGVPC